MVAFESFRSFAEELLMWQAEKAGQGINIGGGSNVSFVVDSEGEQLKIAVAMSPTIRLSRIG